jgi:DNA-binding transcriptional LysR family regulator
MKLRHLETFVMVAEELHFGRAAARLNVAQPAVSQTIRGLEEHLGVALFDRTRRQVELTQAGELFLAEALRILGDLDSAVAAARQLGSGRRGRLRVGFTVACAVSVVPGLVVAFMEAHPEVDVSLIQLGTAAQIEALELGRLDLGFSVLTPPDPRITQRLVAPDRLHAFLPAGHPLGRRDEVEAREVLRHPFILTARAQEPRMHQEFHALCRAHQIEPRVVLEVEHLEAMLGFVAAGLGVSFAPSAASAFASDRVTSRPLTPPMRVDIHALWSARRLPPTAERFLAHLDEVGEPA